MEVDKKKTYLAMIASLPGSKMFQALYATNDRGETIDISEGGKLSCAFVVSSVLTLFELLDRPHATVASTVRYAQESGWTHSSAPTIGGLVVWPALDGHAHIGFYVGDGKCISNSAELRSPSLHELVMKDGRAPELFLQHTKFLD